MAKTQWPIVAPFGILTPALQELYWGTNGSTGHDHKGLDSDGSCPQIALNDAVSDYKVDTFEGNISSTYFTTPVTAEFTYVKIGAVITLLIPDFLGQHASNAELQIAPVAAAWPGEIRPATTQSIPIIVQKANTTDEVRPGRIVIPNAPAGNMVCWITGSTLTAGIMKTDEFGTGATKGILRQSISYIVD